MDDLTYRLVRLPEEIAKQFEAGLETHPWTEERIEKILNIAKSSADRWHELGQNLPEARVVASMHKDLVALAALGAAIWAWNFAPGEKNDA